MPIEHNRRGSKATTEERIRISPPFGSKEMEAIGGLIENNAGRREADSLSEVAAVCRRILAREGLPDDMRPLIWTTGSKLDWREAPADLKDLPSRYSACCVDGAAERGLIEYESPAGYAARILGALWRLERARDDGNHRQAEGLAFRVGGLVMEAHHKRYIDRGWDFIEGPRRERYDRLARLIKNVVEVRESIKPAQVLLEVIAKDQCLPLDQRAIEAFHAEVSNREERWLELRDGQEVSYSAFAARVRRMKKKLDDAEPDASD